MTTQVPRLDGAALGETATRPGTAPAVPGPAPTGAEPDGAAALDLPRAPSPSLLWTRALVVASVAVGAFLIDGLSGLLLNWWLLQSLGYESVFRTNLTAQTLLFVTGAALVTAAVAAPAVVHRVSAPARRTALWVGVLLGLLMGRFLAGEYLEFLGPTADVVVGEVDPVFGHDLSFYLFDLPAIEILLETAFLVALAALVASTVTALASRDTPRPPHVNRFVWTLARVGTPLTAAAAVATGLLAASNVWLTRFDLLRRPNFEDSTEFTGAGAEYVDVVGFFSTKNSIYVEALAVLALSVGVALKLRSARRAALDAPEHADVRRGFGVAGIALVLLPGITADLVFRAGVAVRDETLVAPNEPVVQLPYLQRHIDATNKAFGMDALEEATFVPNGPGDPLPDLDALLASPTVTNAPLWSGFINRYGRRIAPQYVARILAAEGDMTVYGPTMEIFEAQERLRPYYSFLDVDTLVADVDGDPTMVASAVRELPQDVIRPWLSAWGQRSLLFTHGHGLVTAPTADRTPTGEPAYTSRGIPTRASAPALGADDQSVYYGEGAVRPAFSRAAGLAEHDVATDQGRTEVEGGPETGIRMDSLLKRLVIGYEQGDLVDVLFSDLVTDDTRAHVFRRPLERVEQVAPFLSLDTDPYAFSSGSELTWMVNALTTSYMYPYSGLALLGDNSDLRTEERPLELVNYAADSVKATVSAATGQVELYRISDEPLIEMWSQIYPDLFRPAERMPEAVRDNLQYPQALMSIQFNKIYPFYHQRDAVTFFSGEDLLDDADEVVGPIRGESGAITFSQGLYTWMAEPGGGLPDSGEPVQFALSKSYTPQDALNLRGVVTAYQSGDDYGRLSALKVPKGQFHLGPEQADAAIDQDPFIAQQIGLWNRLGVEVIRGSTSLLVVDGEALYVEPVFIRSRQNPVPQLQRVIVVFRGDPHMGRTLEEALTFAVRGGRLADLGDLPPAPLAVSDPDGEGLGGEGLGEDLAATAVGAGAEGPALPDPFDTGD